MNHQFTPTQDSLDRLNTIFRMMKEKSFHNHYHILFDIRNHIDKEVVTYLEIGAYAGGSASLMASHPKLTNVYSIDLGKPIAKEVVYANIEQFKNPEADFYYFEGDSTDQRVLHQVKEKVKKVDILFIDGDHTKDGVLKDWHNYKDFVNDGGYIIFDDYMDWQHSPEVKMAVDEIVQTHDMSGYKVIGSLAYPELEHTNYTVESSNEFILQKLEKKNELPETSSDENAARIKILVDTANATGCFDKIESEITTIKHDQQPVIDKSKEPHPENVHIGGSSIQKTNTGNDSTGLGTPAGSLSLKSDTVCIRNSTETETIFEATADKITYTNPDGVKVTLPLDAKEHLMGFPIFILESKLKNIEQKPSSLENIKKIRQLQRSLAVLKAPFEQ